MSDERNFKHELLTFNDGVAVVIKSDDEEILRVYIGYEDEDVCIYPGGLFGNGGSCFTFEGEYKDG